MPDASQLAALRRDIDRKPHKIKNVLLDQRIREEFLGGIPHDVGKAVKAFIGHNKESMLKTKPKVSIKKSNTSSHTIGWLAACGQKVLQTLK